MNKIGNDVNTLENNPVTYYGLMDAIHEKR
jgi:hypothetical protein